MRGMRRQLMPHQARFLRWAKTRSAVAAFMEMRLGKSLCAVRWAETRPDVDKALIVSPLSVIPSWRRELALEGIEACEITGSQEEREAAVVSAGRDHKWYLINKEGLLAMSGRVARPSEWVKLPWDLVILDESPFIRNPKAKVTRAALDWLSSARYRAILSGLPNPEGPEDYVTQMLFLGGGEFMRCRDFWSWRSRNMQPGRFTWSVKGPSLVELKREVDSRSFFLRRRDAGMADRKLRQKRWVKLPKRVMIEMRRARREFSVGDRLTMNSLTAMGWEHQLAGGTFEGFEHDAKTSEVVELAQGEFRRQQVVVWARFTAELEAVRRALRGAGVTCAVVNGGVKPADREVVISKFKEGRTRVLIAQPQCLKMGVDLSEAEVAIVVSNYFDYEVRAQLEDRIVHPKKPRPALIVDLIAEGTIDEDVVEALTDKRINAAVFNSRMLAAARRMRSA